MSATRMFRKLLTPAIMGQARLSNRRTGAETTWLRTDRWRGLQSERRRLLDERRGGAKRLYVVHDGHCNSDRTLRRTSRPLLSTAITLSPLASSKLVTVNLSSAFVR